MYEGENTITFSKETFKKLLSKFMSELFHSPIEVTDTEQDYKGVKVDFTAATKAEANDAEKPKEESEEIS